MLVLLYVGEHFQSSNSGGSIEASDNLFRDFSQHPIDNTQYNSGNPYMFSHPHTLMPNTGTNTGKEELPIKLMTKVSTFFNVMYQYFHLILLFCTSRRDVEVQG